MTTNTVKLFDAVALTVDLPKYNLYRGQVGTLVEILADGAAFEVEFSERSGRTYESVGLRLEQIVVLRFETVPNSKRKKRDQIEALQPEMAGAARLGEILLQTFKDTSFEDALKEALQGAMMQIEQETKNQG